MTRRESARMLAALAKLRADRHDFDYYHESDDRDLREAEAELARLLGNV